LLSNNKIRESRSPLRERERAAVGRAAVDQITRSETNPSREDTMKRADLTEKILDLKREKGWSWKHICGQIGGMSEVLITGALLGNL